MIGRFSALAGAILLLAAGCTPPPAPAPASLPEPQRSYPPVDFGGQRVLILPLQAADGLPGTREEMTRELIFALTERDARTVWITPDQLRSALRRTPGYAEDPGALPADAFQHHGDYYIQEPLASVVRRYSAITDARLVLIPRAARWVPWPDQPGGRVRFAAAVVDARTGVLVWMGEADGLTQPNPGAAAVASAAAIMAERMVVAGRR